MSICEAIRFRVNVLAHRVGYGSCVMELRLQLA